MKNKIRKQIKHKIRRFSKFLREDPWFVVFALLAAPLCSLQTTAELTLLGELFLGLCSVFNLPPGDIYPVQILVIPFAISFAISFFLNYILFSQGCESKYYPFPTFAFYERSKELVEFLWSKWISISPEHKYIRPLMGSTLVLDWNIWAFPLAEQIWLYRITKFLPFKRRKRREIRESIQFYLDMIWCRNLNYELVESYVVKLKIPFERHHESFNRTRQREFNEAQRLENELVDEILDKYKWICPLNCATMTGQETSQCPNRHVCYRTFHPSSRRRSLS